MRNLKLYNHLETVDNRAIASHSTETVDRPWDKSPNMRRCPNEPGALKKMHAWMDPDGNPDDKSSYKFPHHEVSEDGTVGAANIAGCRNGLARLAQSDIPSADIEGVRRHLQKHLEDAVGASNGGHVRITNSADSKRAEVYIYGIIGAWEVSASNFVKELKDIGRKDIDLFINSPGGEVFDGLAIYNALKNHRGAVNVYVDGYAVSAASFIAMAGDRIIMAPQSEMMIHDAMGAFQGNAEECRKMLDLLERTSDQIAAIYAEKTDGETKFWRKAMRRESWYNAEESVTAGLADEIGRSNGDRKTENSWNFNIYNYAGRTAAPAPIEVPKLEVSTVIDEFNELARKAIADD